jgi:hypothetical protein
LYVSTTTLLSQYDALQGLSDFQYGVVMSGAKREQAVVL